jgi:hypothetical protein
MLQQKQPQTPRKNTSWRPTPGLFSIDSFRKELLLITITQHGTWLAANYVFASERVQLLASSEINWTRAPAVIQKLRGR